MDIEKSNNSFSAIFFSLALLLTYPINIPFLGFIRFADIVLLLLFIYWVMQNPKIQLHYFQYIISFFCIFFVSLGYGIVVKGITHWVSFVFIYKYLVVFMCYYSLLFMYNELSEKQIKRLIVICFLVYFVLLLHIFLFFTYQIPGLHLNWRSPSFPFSEGGDSHLMASFISYMIVGLVVTKKAKILIYPDFLYYVFLFISGLALVFSGSRGGIVVTGLTLALIVFLDVFCVFSKMKISKRSICKLFGFLMIVIAATFILKKTDNNTGNMFAERSLSRTFDFKNDLLGPRWNKIELGFKEVVLEGPVLIGIGLTSADGIWYDNGVISLLISSGIIGLVVFFLLILKLTLDLFYLSKKNGRHSEFYALCILMFCYIMSNIIVTEFFLVTRHLLPFAILSSLIISLIHKTKTCRVAWHLKSV